MTDSEDEPELDEHINVSHAVECAAIIAIGCVAGLKGLGKIRKGVSKVNDNCLSTCTSVQYIILEVQPETVKLNVTCELCNLYALLNMSFKQQSLFLHPFVWLTSVACKPAPVCNQRRAVLFTDHSNPVHQFLLCIPHYFD